MATIVYLDAEDEITSAASRIRSAGDTRVGLVLPFGSRVATSRINFRLLAREAQANGRRLDIVAPDASARALAAAAGLGVFASVGEYEAALDADDEAAGPGSERADGRPGNGAAAVGDAGAGMLGAAAMGPTGAAAGSPQPGAGGQRRGGTPIAEPASSDGAAPGITGVIHPPEPSVRRGPAPAGRRGPGRGLLALLLAVVALVAVGGVAAFLFLPTAEITVTPRIEPVGPVAFSVVADPDATAVDPVAGVIPATTVAIPVTATGSFDATGTRVEQTKARGGVRFTNCDPSAPYSIPAGSVVSTRGGIAFLTDETVFLPVAGISGTPPNVQVECTTSEVSITAREAGPDGNVGPGNIRVVPARYNRSLVTVTNPRATTGGTREEFPKVVQKDIDAALEQLRLDAEAQFQVELESPHRLPPGTTVFPETAVLGELSPTVDPATLLDQEVATFELGLAGSGTVQAADASPVERIAEERLQASISDGYELVEGSTPVEVGEGTVLDGVITFRVEGSAQELRPLDAAELERLVLGMSEQQAIETLEPYGAVEVVLWPDFVGAIPTMDGRVTLNIGPPTAPDPTPAPSPTAVPPSEEPEAEPSSPEESPGDGDPDEPVPSG